jgi:hypothetical protein
VDRRTFLGTIAGSLVLAPLAAEAQRPDRRSLNSCILRTGGWPHVRCVVSLFVDERRVNTEDEPQS